MKYSKIIAIVIGGTILDFLLLALAGGVLGSHFGLPRLYLEARGSAAAYNSLLRAFEAKNIWMDCVAIPIIACFVGGYAGLFRSQMPGRLAVACLSLSLAYEILSQPVHTWAVSHVVRYFGMRAISLTLAIASAILVRKLLTPKQRLSATAT